MRDGGGYAFPSEHPFPEGGSDATRWYTGMTMRQWYKGTALRRALYLSKGTTKSREMDIANPAEVAEICGEIADAMIAEDEKAKEGEGE